MKSTLSPSEAQQNSVSGSRSRRQFLQTVAAASVASVVLPKSLGAVSGPKPLRKKQSVRHQETDRLRFATIGLRNQGWAITRKALPLADCVALADVDQGILGTTADKVEKQQEQRPDTCEDYRRILERDDIHAVLIATPDHWHTKIAVEAMLANKDVYCEKPLTLTIDEGKLIEKVVRQTGRVFQVGTQQRTESDQRFLKAIALLRDGRIGQLQRVTCGIGGMEPSPQIPVAEVPAGLNWDMWQGPALSTDYRALPEMREGYGGGVPKFSNCHYAFRNWHQYSGGKLTDWGAHHVDIACWAMGGTGPSRIVPEEYNLPVAYKDGYPVKEDQYNVATQFKILAMMPDDIELMITSEGDNGILFEGSEGRFFVNRGKLTGKPVELLEENPLAEDAIEKVYGGPVSSNHMANFVEAIQARQQPISDVHSHNRMLEICHLSNIAMRLGRELKWDSQRREIIGDAQANTFLSREPRQGYEIEM